MLRWTEQPGPLRIAVAMLAITTISAALQATSRAGEPILYAPGETRIEYVDSLPEAYVPAYPEGNRLYGLRNFKPPGKNIYEPPPIYHPTGYLPGPFWPYYGFYGSGYYAPYGAFYYGGY